MIIVLTKKGNYAFLPWRNLITFSGVNYWRFRAKLNAEGFKKVLSWGI